MVSPVGRDADPEIHASGYDEGLMHLGPMMRNGCDNAKLQLSARP